MGRRHHPITFPRFAPNSSAADELDDFATKNREFGLSYDTLYSLEEAVQSGYSIRIGTDELRSIATSLIMWRLQYPERAIKHEKLRLKLREPDLVDLINQIDQSTPPPKREP